MPEKTAKERRIEKAIRDIDNAFDCKDMFSIKGRLAFYKGVNESIESLAKDIWALALEDQQNRGKE